MKSVRPPVSGDVNMSIRSVFLPSCLLILWSLAGCGIQTAEFPGRDPGRVWSAMVTAAEEPVYPDWRVIDNEVWTNRDQAEIEIYRVLRRDLIEPGHEPIRESETWKFQIRMIAGDPPTVRFRSRQISVPAHVWEQGKQYFDDVATLLGGTTDPEAVFIELVEPAEDEVSVEIEELPVVGEDILDPPVETPSE